MSMISSLIDMLNKSADEWNGSNMFELARMCREAADTIWQLRDDLQRANTENAKLREELADMPKCAECEAMLDCDECLRVDASQKERKRVDYENAELRELVRDMNACIEALCSMVENSPGCSMCLTNQDEEKPCAAADVYCRMRELGVEV